MEQTVSGRQVEGTGMRIALIGDSIRLGYEPYVKELLKGHRVVSPSENGGDSTNLLEHFDEWFGASRADVVHVNCGLHDVRFGVDTRRHQISPTEYEANLGELAGRLRALASATVVWALTTPVVEIRHNSKNREFTRHLRDIESYNSIARTVMGASGIMVHDLFAAVDRAGAEKLISDDGVHFTEEGSRFLAKNVADFLARYLG
jgi:lysophospholipase L1-like esterase